IDPALPAPVDIGPDQIDGDVGAAIAGRSDAPEDQDAEQHASDIKGIGNRIVQRVAQQNRDENVERDDADESCRDPLDRVDKAVHRGALHLGYPIAIAGRAAAEGPAAAGLDRRGAPYCASALYLASEAFSSFIAWSGSTPVFFTPSAQVLTSGSAAFFHCASWSAVSV